MSNDKKEEGALLSLLCRHNSEDAYGTKDTRTCSTYWTNRITACTITKNISSTCEEMLD